MADVRDAMPLLWAAARAPALDARRHAALEKLRAVVQPAMRATSSEGFCTAIQDAMRPFVAVLKELSARGAPEASGPPRWPTVSLEEPIEALLADGTSSYLDFAVVTFNDALAAAAVGHAGESSAFRAETLGFALLWCMILEGARSGATPFAMRLAVHMLREFALAAYALAAPEPPPDAPASDASWGDEDLALADAW